MITDGARAEILMLAKGGQLLPKAVVEFARNPETALHGCFTWDKDENSEKWLLHQARMLIRVVAVRELKKPEPDLDVVYVSLRDDRSAGNGYRSLAVVLTDDALREKLLADAMKDMRYFREKYQRLQELQPIFDAHDRVEGALGKVSKAA